MATAPRYPVTSAVAAGAITVTLMWWSGQDITASFMDDHVWARGEVWRALTATFPHVNFFHLAFNLYWLWTFGTLVERIYGHLRCLAIYVLLATGSMLADFAILDGGVGLSGLGYGLWGLLMILERRDSRFADAVDAQTNQMFVAWFFICIVTTITHVMPVANIAHGAGAVLGMLLALAIGGGRTEKGKARFGLAALMVLILLGGTVFWPRVNLSSDADAEIEHAALEALDRGDIQKGVKWLEIAAHKRNAPARVWYNLGVAYGRAGRSQDAAAAFNEAGRMPDADEQIQNAAMATRPLMPANTNR